jgi:RimJ/RimL family protein N-acetyltransferase
MTMDFNRITQELKTNNLFLKPITTNDRTFINGMFSDTEIKRYYIVPKEAQQDYKRLVDYWLNDIKNGAGTCWIIIEKGKGIFSHDKQIGFVAFEFRDTLKNARISYAILPEFRRKGLAATSVKLVIERLKQEGVERIEADIDRYNINSEKVVEKLGFTANKRNALVDPEIMRDGEIRFRALWKKELIEFKKETTNGRIPLNATKEVIVPIINDLVNEINSKGQHPSLLVRYFYLLGRIKFIERNYEEAQQAFGQCNMITMNEGLPEIHENYYWFAKINEAKGEKGNAKMYYDFALEKYNENPNYISKSEIEREMNS